jgi:hypothetical protein
MKKKITLILIFCAFTFINVRAQISLGAGDFPTAGLNFKYYGTDTTTALTPLVSLGSPGAGGTYSISAGIASHIVDTVIQHYVATSQTPFPADHPNSNVGLFTWPVMLDAGIGTPDTVAWLWSFFNSTATGVNMNGLSAIIDTQMFGTTIPGPLVPFSKNYNPGLTIMSSSFNLGYHVHDSIYHCIVLGVGWPIARVEYITRDVEIDGWGTLTTPKGSYDVLRGKVRIVRAENYIQPADTANPTFHDYFWEYYYEFYAKGLGAPACLIRMDENFANVLTVNFTDFPPAGIQETRLPAMSIYPNPATDHIIIGPDITSGKPLTLVISDISGKRIREIQNPEMSSINTMNIDVSGLEAGTYFVQVVTEKKIFSQKFIKM